MWLESQRKERKRKERLLLLFSKPFSNRPHTPKLHRSPSVTSNASVTSNGYLPAAVSLPEWLRGTKIHCTQVRVGSNPIADMSGWSHSARKRKLALSTGVALRSTQVRMGKAPSLTHVAGDTRKGRKRKEHVVCLSVTPFGWRRKGRKRKERVVCLSVTPFLEAFF